MVVSLNCVSITWTVLRNIQCCCNNTWRTAQKNAKSFHLSKFPKTEKQWNFSECFTQKSLIPIKKGHCFLEISVARPAASDPAVLREPAKTSVEDLGVAAKPRDINKKDCQEQHCKMFYPGERAPALLWSDTPVQRTT